MARQSGVWLRPTTNHFVWWSTFESNNFKRTRTRVHSYPRLDVADGNRFIPDGTSVVLSFLISLLPGIISTFGICKRSGGPFWFGSHEYVRLAFRGFTSGCVKTSFVCVSDDVIPTRKQYRSVLFRT